MFSISLASSFPNFHGLKNVIKVLRAYAHNLFAFEIEFSNFVDVYINRIIYNNYETKCFIVRH